jgi:phosphonate transport system permease protein
MLWMNKRNLLYAFFIIAAIYGSALGTQIDLSRLAQISNMFTFIREGWMPPAWEVLPSAIRATLITLEMAFLGTIVAIVFALPLSFLAARNVTHPVIYNIVRTVLSFLRSVPEIVFGLIFVTVVGLGPFPAILAIILHNIGVLGKLISELIGAGGIGQQLFIHFKIFQYEKVAVDVFMIMLLVVIIDYFSAVIRSKII